MYRTQNVLAIFITDILFSRVVMHDRHDRWRDPEPFFLIRGYSYNIRGCSPVRPGLTMPLLGILEILLKVDTSCGFCVEGGRAAVSWVLPTDVIDRTLISCIFPPLWASAILPLTKRKKFWRKMRWKDRKNRRHGCWQVDIDWRRTSDCF